MGRGHPPLSTQWQVEGPETQDPNCAGSEQGFVQSGKTGRLNALADQMILGIHAVLSRKLAKLSARAGSTSTRLWSRLAAPSIWTSHVQLKWGHTVEL